jgi:hypothetical protein
MYFIKDVLCMFFYVLWLQLQCSGNDLIHCILKMNLIFV